MFDTLYHSDSLEKYSFLITGGAGFIGSNLVEYLLKYNAGKVRVLDNLSNGFYKNIEEFIENPTFEFIEGDIRNLETCKKACEGIDYISHQAALGSVPRSIGDPITTNDVNVSGFLNMLVAAKENNIKRLVYAASSSTYGDSKALPKVEDVIGKPLSPYAITKYVNELYAGVFSNLYHLDLVGLRYFNVFGPKQDPSGAYAAVIPLFMKAALENQSPVFNGDGEHTRDFTFIENVIQANIKSFFYNRRTTGHEVINVAFGERTSLKELWSYISDIAGVSLNVIYNPERAGDVKDSLASIEKAKTLINYLPSFDVKAGLQITYNWFKQSCQMVKS
ncbi:SDR family oxidoreductase [Daejeonella sp.]|uniref:SDR family oxidoreductase n=1 Tax=Daejeonella sp. TaxID=2805397 RepID=UPI00272FCB5D|nr:SDR family oxidoreductase [Daejeonella sp.]MDP2414348.1 SDR family oxidoreductase [Daejeonella sp.]